MARIYPIRLTRRQTAKKWHILRSAGNHRTATADKTECGQTIPFSSSKHGSTSNPALVDCYDCLSSHLSRKLGEQAAREVAADVR